MNSKQEIELLFDRLGHLNRSYLRDFAYAEGLNLRQLETMLYLSNCNKYSDTPLALSEYLSLTKGTVSQTVISLEGKKLLQKKRDLKDGRVVHLHLTTRGQKIVMECTEGSVLAKALAKSTDSEAIQRSLTELLREIQYTNSHRAFGACHTCKFFRKKEGLGQLHQCGLTLESLHTKESLQLCREHTEPIAENR